MNYKIILPHLRHASPSLSGDSSGGTRMKKHNILNLFYFLIYKKNCAPISFKIFLNDLEKCVLSPRGALAKKFIPDFRKQSCKIRLQL